MCQVETLPKNKIILLEIKSAGKIPRALKNMIPHIKRGSYLVPIPLNDFVLFSAVRQLTVDSNCVM